MDGRIDHGDDVVAPCDDNVSSTHVCSQSILDACARVDNDDRKHDAVDSGGTSVVQAGVADGDNAVACGGTDDVHARNA